VKLSDRFMNEARRVLDAETFDGIMEAAE